MSDLISRADAIRLTCGTKCGCDPDECGLTMERDGAEYCGDIQLLMSLPSVQPEAHEKRTETHGVCLDAISRQDAIDAVQERIKQIGCENNVYVLSIIQVIREVPSSRSEIIRCKDCKDYQTGWEPSIPGEHYCATMDTLMPGDAYCSYAERRIDE